MNVDTNLNTSILPTDSSGLGVPTALATQVGGTHYKEFKIQPAEFIHANNIGFLEGNAIKYCSRWKLKGGMADLDKAIHCIQLLKELENGKVNISGNSVQSSRMGSKEIALQGSIEESGRANGAGHDSVLSYRSFTSDRYV